MRKNIFKGASINGEHTLKDWNMAIENTDVVPLPEPVITQLAIPGRNGMLDLTESLTGDVAYHNRTIRMELGRSMADSEGEALFSRLFNQYHGQTVSVIFDGDEEHYFKGRCILSSPQKLRTMGRLTLIVDAEPYRYEQEETVLSYVISGTQEVTIINTRMWVCPVISASAACELLYGTSIYALSEGNQQVPDFILKEGATVFQLRGAAEVTFTFRKGVL